MKSGKMEVWAFISQIKAICFVSFDNLINSSSILPKGSSENLRLTTNNKTSPIMEVKKISYAYL